MKRQTAQGSSASSETSTRGPTGVDGWLLSPRVLTGLAAANVGLHIVAIALAGLGMRPGTPIVPLDERMATLARAPAGWTVGWAAWMLCAVCDVLFVAAVARRAPERSATAALAVAVTVAGAAVDLLWDTVHMLVIPRIAAGGAAQAALFVAVERAAWACGAIVANGLYSAAVLLVTVALAEREGGIPRGVRVSGVGTFVGGMAMVVAGFTGDPRHLEVVSGPTIAFFCAWVVLVTRAGLAGSGK